MRRRERGLVRMCTGMGSAGGVGLCARAQAWVVQGGWACTHAHKHGWCKGGRLARTRTNMGGARGVGSCAHTRTGTCPKPPAERGEVELQRGSVHSRHRRPLQAQRTAHVEG